VEDQKGGTRPSNSFVVGNRDSRSLVRIPFLTRSFILTISRASFAHGVPPSIFEAHYDVALPSMADIISVCGSSDKLRSSAEIFICLCSLSEVLGDILPLVYDLRTKRGASLAKQLRKLDVDLDNWEQGLPEWLQGSLNKPLTPIISGCSNFQLGALSVKLLLHRIRLHVSYL
jgi:hypothetical protein